MAEVLAACQNSTQQDCRVYRRDFGIPDSFPCVYVGEMIEKTAMLRDLFPQKTERRENSFQSIFSSNETAVVSDAQGGEAEAGGGDTRNYSLIVFVDIAPVLNHSGLFA